VASMFFTWTAWTLMAHPRGVSDITRTFDLFELLNSQLMGVATAFTVSSALFVVGSATALGSPLGGILQGAGLWVFAGTLLSELGSHFWRYELGPGPFIALASAIIVLLGLVYPRGIGYDPKRMGPAERLLAIAVEPDRTSAGV